MRSLGREFGQALGFCFGLTFGFAFWFLVVVFFCIIQDTAFFIILLVVRSNGAVEQAIQSVRTQANTILSDLEASAGVRVRTDSALHCWSWKHAVFILSRFRAISGVTPYEAVQGSRYSGKVVKFGETVMARIKQQKGEPRFVAGVWLTKCGFQDLHLVSTDSGELLLTRTMGEH